jgi:hypothetical protein
MRPSFNIWIPSSQRSVRFYEMTGHQEKALSAIVATGDVSDFIYYTNNLIQELLIEPLYDQFTIIDRFVILISLRIKCIGSSVSVITKCPKCQKDLRSPLLLNNMLDTVFSGFDKRYIRYVRGDNVQVLLDAPSINWALMASQRLTDKMDFINLWCLLMIRVVQLEDRQLVFDHNYPIAQLSEIVDNLPPTVFRSIAEVVNEFITETTITPIMEIKCSQSGCDGKIDYDFSVPGMDSFLQSIFSNHVANVYSDSAVLMKLGLTFRDVLDLVPAERSYMVHMVKKEMQEAEHKSENKVPMINPEAAKDFIDPFA